MTSSWIIIIIYSSNSNSRSKRITIMVKMIIIFIVIIIIICYDWQLINFINPGSPIPQVEARKRCSRGLFTSSGRATALIDRQFWYTFLQQSMTHLTNTAILIIYASRFHWRFSGNWQEHICERNIGCFVSPSHLSLGRDRLNVTVCRTCTVPLCTVGCTHGDGRPTPQHPHPTLFDYNNFKVSKSSGPRHG